MDATTPTFPFGLSYSDIGLLSEIVHLGTDQHWAVCIEGLDKMAAAGLLKQEEHHGQMTYVVVMPDAGRFLDRPDVAEVYQREYVRQSAAVKEMRDAGYDRLVASGYFDGEPPMTKNEAKARFFQQFADGGPNADALFDEMFPEGGQPDPCGP